MKAMSKETQEIADIVKLYSNATYLFKPEEIILDKLRCRLPNWDMLDIGVGGGRTAVYFATLAREYIGIDFNEQMIQACKDRFPNRSEKIKFLTHDVRAMDIFENGTFDFILFSNSGLDYISHAERLDALREIRRVGKEGSYFLFSTHNLNAADKIFAFNWSRNPYQLSKNVIKYGLLRMLNTNPRRLKSMEYAMVKDDWYFHKMRWLVNSIREGRGCDYYIRPDAQIAQLSELGFTNIKVYSSTGQEIRDKSTLNNVMDKRLHFFCTI